MKCLKDGCKFKKSASNDYCNLHEKYAFEKEMTSNGFRLCGNLKRRGCRNILSPDSLTIRCNECNSKEREKDNKKRKLAILHRKQEEATENNETKTCVSCTIKRPVVFFQGIKEKQETLTCLMCRQSNSNNDKRRDKQHRRDICRNSIRSQFTEYKKNAKIRNIAFEISFEEFKSIVYESCNYCDSIHKDRGFNGIDRLDSSRSYEISNIVSCCKICNYMKRTDLPDIFLQRIGNIVYYQDTGLTSPTVDEISSNHGSMSINPVIVFRTYRRRAETMGVDFMLTQTDVAIITAQDCYMCGKKPGVNHRNGIDRYDNDKEYEISNCRPCCRDCNFLKLNLRFDDMILHLRQILRKYNK